MVCPFHSKSIMFSLLGTLDCNSVIMEVILSE